MRTLPPAPEPTSKAEKHRKYPWCRLMNNFVDLPLWRVVAGMTRLPLTTVQAFVIRLDSFANAAEPRGFVGEFSAQEFAVALDIAVDDAARLYAALEHPDVRWVDQEFVPSFYVRNPDKEDTSYNERKARSRARRRVRDELQRRSNIGAIDDEQRDYVLAMLKAIADPQLFALEDKLLAGVTVEGALATLSTGHAGHIVTARDIVTVTPRAEHTRAESLGPVDNSGRDAVGESAGLPTAASGEGAEPTIDAEAWLSTKGKAMVVDRLTVNPTLAETKIERWRRDLPSPQALVDILQGAGDQVGARFLVAVDQGIQRARTAQPDSPRLPLGPVVIRKAADG